VFELFADELKKNIEAIATPELKIVFEKKDAKFLNNVLNMINLFDIE